MKERDLNKLKRSELLELMLAQSQEIDELRAELEQAREALKRREIALAEAGNIAEAALRLNQVFEQAQAAADQYLENVRRISGDQEPQQEKGDPRG